MYITPPIFNNSSTARMDAAKELKEQGNQFYKQEKFLEALQRYSEASALQPQDPGIIYIGTCTNTHIGVGGL